MGYEERKLKSRRPKSRQNRESGTDPKPYIVEYPSEQLMEQTAAFIIGQLSSQQYRDHLRQFSKNDEGLRKYLERIEGQKYAMKPILLGSDRILLTSTKP